MAENHKQLKTRQSETTQNTTYNRQSDSSDDCRQITHVIPDAVRPVSIHDLLLKNDLINRIILYIPKDKSTYYETLADFKKEWNIVSKNFSSPEWKKIKDYNWLFGKILNSPNISIEIIEFLSKTMSNRNDPLPRTFRKKLVTQLSQISKRSVSLKNIKSNETIPRSSEYDKRWSVISSIKTQNFDGSVINELVKGFLQNSLNIDGKYSLARMYKISFDSIKNEISNLEFNFNQYKQNLNSYLQLNSKNTKYSVRKVLYFIIYTVLLEYLYNDSNETINGLIEKFSKFIKICHKYRENLKDSKGNKISTNIGILKNKGKKNLNAGQWEKFCEEVKELFPSVIDFLFYSNNGKYSYTQINDGNKTVILGLNQKTKHSVSIDNKLTPFTLFPSFSIPKHNTEQINVIEFWFLNLIQTIKFCLIKLQFPYEQLTKFTNFTLDELNSNTEYTTCIDLFVDNLEKQKNISELLCSTFDRISEFMALLNLSDNTEIKSFYGYKHIIDLWNNILRPIKIHKLLSFKTEYSKSILQPFMGNIDCAIPRQFQIDVINFIKQQDSKCLTLESPTGSGKSTTVVVAKATTAKDQRLIYIAPQRVNTQIARLLGNELMQNNSGMINFFSGELQSIVGCGGYCFDLLKERQTGEVNSKKIKMAGRNKLSLTQKQQLNQHKQKDLAKVSGFQDKNLTEEERKQKQQDDKDRNNRGEHELKSDQKPSYITCCEPTFVPVNLYPDKKTLIVIDDVAIDNLPKQFAEGKQIVYSKKQSAFFWKYEDKYIRFFEHEQKNILDAFITFQNSYVNQAVRVALNKNIKLLLVGATLSKKIIDFTQNIMIDLGVSEENAKQDISDKVYGGNWNIYSLNNSCNEVRFPLAQFINIHFEIFDSSKKQPNFKRMFPTDPNYSQTLQSKNFCCMDWDKRSTLQSQEDFANVLQTYRTLGQDLTKFHELNDDIFSDSYLILLKAIQELDTIKDKEISWCSMIISKSTLSEIYSHFPDDKKNGSLKLLENNIDYTIQEIENYVTNKKVISRTKFYTKFGIPYDFCSSIFSESQISIIAKTFEGRNHIFWLLAHNIYNFEIGAPHILDTYSEINILFIGKNSKFQGFDHINNRLWLENGFKGDEIAQALGRMNRGKQDELDDIQSRSYMSKKSMFELCKYENLEIMEDKSVNAFLELFKSFMHNENGHINWQKPNKVITHLAEKYKFVLHRTNPSDKQNNYTKTSTSNDFMDLFGLSNQKQNPQQNTKKFEDNKDIISELFKKSKKQSTKKYEDKEEIVSELFKKSKKQSTKKNIKYKDEEPFNPGDEHERDVINVVLYEQERESRIKQAIIEDKQVKLARVTRKGNWGDCNTENESLQHDLFFDFIKKTSKHFIKFNATNLLDYSMFTIICCITKYLHSIFSVSNIYDTSEFDFMYIYLQNFQIKHSNLINSVHYKLLTKDSQKKFTLELQICILGAFEIFLDISNQLNILKHLENSENKKFDNINSILQLHGKGKYCNTRQIDFEKYKGDLTRLIVYYFLLERGLPKISDFRGIRTYLHGSKSQKNKTCDADYKHLCCNITCKKTHFFTMSDIENILSTEKSNSKKTSSTNSERKSNSELLKVVEESGRKKAANSKPGSPRRKK